MNIHSEINAIYYALRLLHHQMNISRIEGHNQEFTQDEETRAFLIIQEIQARERLTIDALPDSKRLSYMASLTDDAERLANEELAGAVFDVQQGDSLLRDLRASYPELSYPTLNQSKNSQISEPPDARTFGVRKKVDLVCFSHLRWDFIYQRPQHLMTRFADQRRVFFVEEPVYSEAMRLEVSQRAENLFLVVPRLPAGIRTEVATNAVVREMLSRFIDERRITDFIAWYETPAPFQYTKHLNPSLVVYDCMDELAALKGAPPNLMELERDLLARANLVFTAGHSLYEEKQNKHNSVYAFPNSIDRAHFNRSRLVDNDPHDQYEIPHPRLGFFGVLDERLDIELLRGIAESRPDWNLVLIGPVVKIDATTLPSLPNIHYLGAKSYDELPVYIAGWDVALLPFAMNEATRFISPIKTSEYLAAGKPVVSTPIRDVVKPYGELGLVRIATDTSGFISSVSEVLADYDRSDWLARVDAFLAQTSWDNTWKEMCELIEKAASETTVTADSAAADIMGRLEGRVSSRRT